MIVCSPYRGDVTANVAYAERCMGDSLRRGEAPLAPHLLYTQVLDDALPEHRGAGIACGLAWLGAADVLAVYSDRGQSEGMKAEIRAAMSMGTTIDYRRIGEEG